MAFISNIAATYKNYLAMPNYIITYDFLNTTIKFEAKDLFTLIQKLEQIDNTPEILKHTVVVNTVVVNTVVK
jgi:hypothetical protein